MVANMVGGRQQHALPNNGDCRPEGVLLPPLPPSALPSRAPGLLWW